jgi:hypothetical protein
MTNAQKDFSIEVSTLNIFSSSSNFTSSIIVIDAMVLGFSYSKHTIKRGITTLASYLDANRIAFLHSTIFHNLESLEMWIQQDDHHVVSMPCIKKPQKIQKRFDHLYNIKSHIFVEKQDFSFKRLKNFRRVIKLQQLSLNVHSQCDNYCQNI